MSLTRGRGSGGGTSGRGIVSFVRTAGDGSPGTTDTYTITYTDATTSTLTVHNGADGSGGGGGGTTVRVDGSPAATLDLASAAVTADDVGAIAKALGTAKGDLIGFTASGAPVRIPVGSNGQSLKADSTKAAGVGWA